MRKTLEEHLHRCADGYDLGDLAVEDVAFPTKHRTCEEVQGEDIPEDLVASPKFSGLVRRLDQLMANATKSESIYEQHGLQFVKYGQGGRFDMHYDRNYNNIFATAMVYCSSAESEGDGGETFFPNIDFHVRPTTGMAVVWFNCEPGGNIERDSAHMGLPHYGSKPKYILNRFYVGPDENCALAVPQLDEGSAQYYLD